MANCEFYSVPEIDLKTVTDAVFGSCIIARRSMEKAAWVGEQWVDLAGRRPEELPPCFLTLAVLSETQGPSPRTGWMTKHGWWEPKDMFAVPGPGSTIRGYNSRRAGGGSWTRTTLVFRPNDGSKSDLAMNLYSEIICYAGKALLKEDMALCRVFRVPKGKAKVVVHSDTLPPLSGYAAAEPIHELPEVDLSDLDISILDVQGHYPDFWLKDDGVGGWDVPIYPYIDPSPIPGPSSIPSPYINSPGIPNPYIDPSGIPSPYINSSGIPSPYNDSSGIPFPYIHSSGGLNKRPRAGPVGGSNAWGSFTKIYTIDPEVVYAACHHCGRMMKLKGGSKCGTKSLSRHNETCPCKPGSSIDTLQLLEAMAE